MTNRTYEVKSGDTLWKICKDAFKLTSNTDIANKVAEISKKNQISSDSIFIGQKIDLGGIENLKKENINEDIAEVSVFRTPHSKPFSEINLYNEWNIIEGKWWADSEKTLQDGIIKEGFIENKPAPSKLQLISKTPDVVVEMTKKEVNTSNICTDKTIQKLTSKKIYTQKELETIKNTKEYSKKEILQIAEEEAKKRGLDPILVKAVIEKESNSQQFAKNKWSGASGLMQLMPKTAKWLGCDNVFDAKQNIKAGVKYLDYLLKKYKGNVKHALCAYNFGEGNYDKYLKGYKKLPKETLAYVPKVMENYNKIANA